MKRYLLLALFACLCAVSATAGAQSEKCQTLAIEKAHETAKVLNNPVHTRQAYYRTLLECAGVTGDIADIEASLATARQGLAEEFLGGRISHDAYMALLENWETKVARARKSPEYAKALASADADHDFVPDSLDHCPKTPTHVTTDAAGCPIRCESGFIGSGRKQPACIALLPDRKQKVMLDAALEMPMPLNLACVNAPRPTTSAVSAFARWGKEGVEKTGFAIAALQVRNQPTGCEYFYEFEVLMRGPNIDSLPASPTFHVVYSNKEDQDDRDRATLFPLPLDPKAPSPGRQKLASALGHYDTMLWRVRVINGAQLASEWSDYASLTYGMQVPIPLSP